MKNLPVFFLSCILLLSACGKNEESRSDQVKDSVPLSGTDSVNKSTPQPETTKKDNLQAAYDQIIEAIRKGDYSKVDAYINPAKGFFLITTAYGADYYSYQHGAHFADLSGGEGPEAEAAEQFLQNIKNAKSELLTLQDLGKEDPDACSFKKEGAYRISLRKVKQKYSEDYRSHKQGGTEIDQDLLQSLTELEGGFTSKVYLSRLGNDMKQVQTMYFSEFEGKIYLTALDLTNCH